MNKERRAELRDINERLIEDVMKYGELVEVTADEIAKTEANFVYGYCQCTVFLPGRQRILRYPKPQNEPSGLVQFTCPVCRQNIGVVYKARQ